MVRAHYLFPFLTPQINLMYAINTIEGLLFRSYLSNYNLSLLHHCIKSGDENVETIRFRQSAKSATATAFAVKIAQAKEGVERTVCYCQKHNISMLPHFHPGYPSSLLAIKNFPPLLFVKGRFSRFLQAAIVGTRCPSILAANKTAQIVRTFAEHGFGITSGLADGIDTMAHQSAIHYSAYNLAVLPTALDNIYPHANSQLAEEILYAGGAIITELAPGFQPAAHPFVMRNRIIAALSEYVVPVEMGRDSGTLHTVNYAIRYRKRLVLCKPGPMEIDYFLRQYEGVILSIRKYKNKEGAEVNVLNDWSALKDCLTKQEKVKQFGMFK